MRERLIRLAISNNGNYYAIKKALTMNVEEDKNIALQDAITIEDDIYPASFLKLKNPPYVLFYKGDLSLLKSPIVAVVGSRMVSDYGKNVTYDIVKRIAKEYVIVSGLAKGIDSIAHQYAKKTIAIVGNGVDVYYPLENKQMYMDIMKKGLILSEYPSMVRPLKHHFPRRNQLIASLANKIIVTQAAIHSGSMITVKEAFKLGKQVYTIPYPYDSNEGVGCNELIMQGARLLLKENVEYELFDNK